MEINELIEPEEWADLPDDAEEAFAMVVQLARPRYRAKLAGIEDEFLLHDTAYGFMNALLGVGTSLGVQPFSTMEIPTPQNFNDQMSREFEAQLSFFLAKAQADVAKRRRAGMVDLNPRDRLTITLAVGKLRVKIQDSEMAPWRKRLLLRRLEEFERELTKGRVNLSAITLTVVTLMTVPGGVSQSYDWAKDVFEPILKPLVEAKFEAEKSDLVGTLITPRLEGPSSGKINEDS